VKVASTLTAVPVLIIVSKIAGTRAGVTLGAVEFPGFSGHEPASDRRERRCPPN
jgi:hypothetical protein